MKNILIIAWIMLSSSLLFAQKTKTVEIWKKPMTGEILNVLYIEHNNIGKIDTLIHFMCRDYQYEQLVEIMTAYSGSPKDFYKFLNDVKVFFNENDPETSDYIQDYKICIKEFYGKRGLWMYERRDKGNGFHAFTLKSLEKFKSKFIAWCKKNNVVYE